MTHRIVSSTTLSSSTAATILNTVSHISLPASGISSSGMTTTRGISGKGRKRMQNHPVSFTAIPNSFMEKNNDFIW